MKIEFSKKIRIMTFLMFPIAYIYVSFTFEYGITSRVLLGIFSVLFLAYGEMMYWERVRTRESIMFFVLTIIIGISYCFELGEVWGQFLKLVFLHAFAVYWVLARSLNLSERESSHLFAWDGINGFFHKPFGNFSLFFKSINETLSQGKQKSSKKIAISLVAILIGTILFIFAITFLKDSDANFEMIMDCMKIEWNWEYIWKALISVIIACYLFGLFGGCYGTSEDEATSFGQKICTKISILNKVPNAVWIGFIILFSIVYIMYFALQGSYMLGAFVMLLPEKYTYSEYAREGFGEMCAVMIINYDLMWLTFRTSETKSKGVKIFGTILMAESLAFALIAFLKLFMYINAYGFTPLRLQSVWLVVVLSYACICILISVHTGKKTAKYWFDASAATLALLTLI